jgi:hypothetical protein
VLQDALSQRAPCGPRVGIWKQRRVMGPRLALHCLRDSSFIKALQHAKGHRHRLQLCRAPARALMNLTVSMEAEQAPCCTLQSQHRMYVAARGNARVPRFCHAQAPETRLSCPSCLCLWAASLSSTGRDHEPHRIQHVRCIVDITEPFLQCSPWMCHQSSALGSRQHGQGNGQPMYFACRGHTGF